MVVNLARFALLFVVLSVLCVGGCSATAGALLPIDTHCLRAAQELEAAKMAKQLQLASSAVEERLNREKNERVKPLFARQLELISDASSALSRIEQMEQKDDPARFAALADVRSAVSRIEPLAFRAAGRKWGQMILWNALGALALALPYLIRSLRRSL